VQHLIRDSTKVTGRQGDKEDTQEIRKRYARETRKLDRAPANTLIHTHTHTHTYTYTYSYTHTHTHTYTHTYTHTHTHTYTHTHTPV
jgi:hypothetical protein